MTAPLLICTDLDRTLIPNGSQAETAGARNRFASVVRRPEVQLAYVTGRHRGMVEEAIDEFNLPLPDFVISDVGSTIYAVGPQQSWQRLTAWEAFIAQDWSGYNQADLHGLLNDLPDLQLQESSRQGRFKLSYFVPLEVNSELLETTIRNRLDGAAVKANLIWSVDDLKGIGLLDLLPARASKLQAVESLMEWCGFDISNTVFCGDSGNDMGVLVSRIPSVLVANAREDVRVSARRQSEVLGHGDRLYCARGDFLDMNGHYSAGILEGIAHFHPRTTAWMACKSSEKGA